MYAYLKGILTSSQPNLVVVEVQGLGYQINIPYRVFGELPQLGENVFFYTSFVVREFAHTLYGFLNAQERDIFEVLMNVTGIGPKMALSLIGHLSLNQMQVAVANSDIPTLCRVPGVGKKTAERLIVELRDKLAAMEGLDSAPVGNVGSKTPHSQKIQDAMSALVNLGYHQSHAQKAIKTTLKELPESADLALIITTSLKNM